MKKEKTYNEAVDGDEGFVPGEGYPSCDGEPCANVSDDSQDGTDTMADAAEGGDKAGAGSDLTAALAEWQDKFIRLQAEFDNYRKRTLKEKMDLVQTGGRDVLSSAISPEVSGTWPMYGSRIPKSRMTSSVPSMPCRRATTSRRCVPA